MFAMQPRLESPRGNRALRLLENPRFRAVRPVQRCAPRWVSRAAAGWTGGTRCNRLRRSSASTLAESSEAPAGGARGPGASAVTECRRRSCSGGRHGAVAVAAVDAAGGGGSSQAEDVLPGSRPMSGSAATSGIPVSAITGVRGLGSARCPRPGWCAAPLPQRRPSARLAAAGLRQRRRRRAGPGSRCCRSSRAARAGGPRPPLRHGNAKARARSTSTCWCSARRAMRTSARCRIPDRRTRLRAASTARCGAGPGESRASAACLKLAARSPTVACGG